MRGRNPRDTMRDIPLNPSKAFIALNPHLFPHATRPNNPAPGPEPKQAVCDDPLGAIARKEGHPGRVSLRVVSYRRRTIDPDNAAPKYFIDCCRYIGLLRDDRLEDIELSISQVKVKKAADERTEITIETP